MILSSDYLIEMEFTIVSLRHFSSATLVKKLAGLAAAVVLLVSCSSAPPKSLVTPLHPVSLHPLQPPSAQGKEPVRGVWLATISRLDWPPVSSINAGSAAVRINQQQKTLTDKLDKLKSLGINTVFFQVKPDGTALWASKM